MSITRVTRREMLRALSVSGAALVLGACSRPEVGGLGSRGAAWRAGMDTAAPGFVLQPDVFVSVGSDGWITVFVARTEMGQGVRTSLAMIVAEELDADFSCVRSEPVIADPTLYGDMTTGGSRSVREKFPVLRQTGATARAMLVEAAALLWGVPIAECITQLGEVIHVPTGDRVFYADVVEEASQLPVPGNVPLKDPASFTLIGTSPPRVEGVSKIDGSAGYGSDVRLPGLRFCMVARAPVIGASVVGFDPSGALAVAGVTDVVQIASGVAVVADNTWAAEQGRAQLSVQWDVPPHTALDSGLYEGVLAEASLTAAPALQVGNPLADFNNAPIQVTGEYTLPLQAHAPAETFNSTADVNPGTCEIWAPTQKPQLLHETAAQQLGLPLNAVRVHTTLVGGGFGRKLVVDDFLEAVQVSAAVGAPVQVLWTRADDMKQGFFRPPSHHRLAGGLAANGDVLALAHRMASPSIRDQHFGGVGAIDQAALKGLIDTPYAYPSHYLGYAKVPTAVRICWWRSVYMSQNLFAAESFLDELAEAGGRDPLDLRMSLSNGVPRLQGVLQQVAADAGWAGTLPPGRFQGLACTAGYDSFLALIAEVSVAGQAITVHRVVVAADCGIVVHPSHARAQIEGSVAFALSATLLGEITIRGGSVEQSSYLDFPVIRIDDMPPVEITFVASQNAPGGLGELAVPSVAPAVANAVYAATGVRPRRLPIRL